VSTIRKAGVADSALVAGVSLFMTMARKGCSGDVPYLMVFHDRDGVCRPHSFGRLNKPHTG
jgi:hypothetical protein